MPYYEIGFKANLAYLKVDKIESLMILIWSRPLNRLSDQTRLLNRFGEAIKIGLWKVVGQAQVCKKFVDQAQTYQSLTYSHPYQHHTTTATPYASNLFLCNNATSIRNINCILRNKIEVCNNKEGFKRSYFWRHDCFIPWEC